jgi:hypothetical protein
MAAKLGTPGPTAQTTAYAGILIILLYATFGLSMMALIEEWDILYLFKTYGSFYITDASSPLPTHRLRPFTLLPFTVGYDLAPLSFAVLHGLQAISLLAKAVAMSSITYWLIANRSIAVACGVIFLLYPADTMQMTLRSLHINWAVALSAWGIALLLIADQLSARVARVPVALLAAACFLSGSLMYEAGIFLAPVPLLLLWAKFGTANALKRLMSRWDCAAIWAAAIAAAALYIAIVSMSGKSYQMEVTGDHATILKDLVLRTPYLFKIAFVRLFVSGWTDGLQMLGSLWDAWPYLAAAVVVIGVLLWSVVAAPVATTTAKPRTLSIIAAGLASATLGYLPYLTSYAHVMTSQRTYLYAALGATIVLAGILSLLNRIARPLAAIVVGVCILAGLGAQWTQMSVYTNLSHRQRAILAGILESAPDAAQPGAKQLLIFDRSGTMNNTWMLRGFELKFALTLLYGDNIAPVVCTEPSNFLSSYSIDSAGRPGNCVETPTGWTIGVGLPDAIQLNKSDVRVLTVEPDLTVTPAGTAAPAAAVAARWKEILGCWPAAACQYKRNAGPSYDYDFGRWWGLDDVAWGAGWREAEWRLPSFNPVSWSWLAAPEGNLWVPLAPRPGRYQLRVQIYTWASTASKESFAISINGVDVGAKWTAPNVVEAEVESGVLKAGLNELRFRAVQNPDNALSIAVDRVTLSPAPSP